jgi:CrcB protein
MIEALVVAAAGSAGALARYQVDGFVQDHTHGALPVGTTLINIAGSLLLGILVGLHASDRLATSVELIAGTGFCGGFTTFSSLMYESTRLAQDGACRAAARVLTLNVVIGVAAAAVGLGVTGAL